MKILCLHGYGTNGDVLRYQTSGLRRLADPSWDFYFLSGEVECPPAPGIDANLPGPYRCWTKSFDAESLAAAYALVDETIDEQGPFDGVLGFSQGAGIIMSYLLELSAARPNDLLPFRFAIFCSPIIPLATDQKYRDSVFNSISPKDLDHLRSGQESQLAQLPEPVRTEATELVKVIKATQSITHEGPVYFLDRPVSEVPCVLHPQIFATRLSIPTLHLRGKIDLPHLKDSMLLTQSFCDSKSQKSIEHSAGHDLPRIGPEVNQIMAAIEWLVEQSLLPVD